MKYLFLAATLPFACSSSSADVSSVEGPLRQLAELVCEQAAFCSCRFGFASVSECVEARMSMDEARQHPGASALHFDDDCAAQWRDALASQGCSTEEPAMPGCYVTYGEVRQGEGCNAHDECALGLQCIWALCLPWGEVGDRCDWDRDCASANLYCAADWTCQRLPVAGRHRAKRIPASLRATATVATNLPRRSSTLLAHTTMGSPGRASRRHQAAWMSVVLTAAGPALVMPVRCLRCELEFSSGVRPR